MDFIESFKQAFESLKVNKLRSILTMLGIVMGVFSIITIVAIGDAAQAYMNSQFERIGANTIAIVYKKYSDIQKDWLTMDDMEDIKKVVPEIKNIATAISRSGTLRIGSKTREASVYGVSSQYRYFDIIDMEEGRFITDFDVSAKARVIVVDNTFAQKYFKRTDIIGETLVFKTPWGAGMNFKIIGVVKASDSVFSGMYGDSSPTPVFMPVTTVQSAFFNNKRLDVIEFSVTEKSKLREIGNRVVKALELKRNKKDLYYAQSVADVQGAVSSILGVVSAVLLVIALITLIVGGIGIINILLVSVTERIREIGVRKALGAQKKDIVLQFITESIMMTGISGLIGIGLGVLAGSIISAIIKIPPVVDIKVIILSFLGSVALGLIFGVYPAKRAADLDPIESLRYE